MSILMEDPQGSYYASMGREQLMRELSDRDRTLAKSQKREAELLDAGLAYQELSMISRQPSEQLLKRLSNARLVLAAKTGKDVE